MKETNQHVVPFGKLWAVAKPGEIMSAVLFGTQKEAINYGRKKAMKFKSELIIHGRNGKIREKNTYGEDRCPPRG
jgi:hypothetical protein